MRKAIYLLLAAAAFTPFFAYAYTVHTGTYSDTGGIQAGSDQVTVSGSSDASAEIHTVITGGTTTSADVVITTESNGVRHTQVRHYDIAHGSSVRIDAATSSRNRAVAAATSSPVRRTKLSPFSNFLNRIFSFFWFR